MVLIRIVSPDLNPKWFYWMHPYWIRRD